MTSSSPAQGFGRIPHPSEVFTDRCGVVVSFDEQIGTGVIVGDSTGAEWYFHCTRISDGSRTIDVATPVWFRTTLGPTGVEAVDIRPAPGG